MVKRLTVNLPESLRRKAKAAAALRGETNSGIIREASAECAAGGIELQESLAGQPIQELDGLRGQFWSGDEPVNDFVAAVREWRHQDTQSQDD